MSVAGFDFGSYNSYIALVRTGGIETVDNEYSYRATPTSVSFTDLMRFSGNSAKSQIVTNMDNTFSYFKNLIGLKYDDPRAQQEMSNLTSSFVRLNDGYIGVETQYLGSKTVFSVTQLVAMMLSDLRATTLKHVPKFPECVFNVPTFFTDTQRRAFLDACAIADIRPVGILNDNTAVCLNYCLFKTELPADNQPPRIVAFVNVGYSSTQVCIASFNKSGFKVLASEGSAQVGGRSLDGVIFQKFAQEFEQKHKLKVTSSRKAVLKLLAESESLKKQMNTATVEMPIKIECFMNEIDFFSKSCRDEMDKLCAKTYQTLADLINLAVKNSGVELANIHTVEAIGGSSRIIGIKNVINTLFGKECVTTLNADEAVAKGCAIQCALLSPVVRIREIQIKDYTPAAYSLAYTSSKGEEKEVAVFKVNDSIPSVREITFPFVDKFVFNVVSKDRIENVTTIGTCKLTSSPPSGVLPEKIVITINLGLSNVVEIVSATFLENRVEQVVETKKEGDGEAKQEGNNASAQSQAQTKTVKHHHNATFEFMHVETQSHNVKELRAKEVQMLQQIMAERERSSAKNALEEFIYSARDKLDVSFAQYLTPAELTTIQSAITQEEDWLYGDGEFQKTEVYRARLSELQNHLLPVSSRYEGFQKCSTSMEKLSVASFRFRKFIDVFKENPTKYEHITPEEYKEYVDRVQQTDAFVNETFSILQNQPKTSLPKVSYQEIEDRYNTLLCVCDKLVKKAENPPPKPAAQPPPAQPEATPNSAPPSSSQPET